MPRKNISVDGLVLKNPSKEQLEEIISWAEKEVFKYKALVTKCQMQMNDYEKFLKETK